MMARDPYCPAAHPDGWLCLLARDHDGPHLSLDNRHRWRGTVGRPVRWRAVVEDLDLSELEAEGWGWYNGPPVGGLPATEPEPPPATAPQLRVVTSSQLGLVTSSHVPPGRLLAAPARLPGYTGIPCDACGSLNTVRSGKCLTCMDCHAAGECG